MHELVVSEPDQTIEFCGLKSKNAMNFIIFADCILFVIVVLMFRDMYRDLRKIRNNPEIGKYLVKTNIEKRTHTGN